MTHPDSTQCTSVSLYATVALSLAVAGIGVAFPALNARVASAVALASPLAVLASITFLSFLVRVAAVVIVHFFFFFDHLFHKPTAFFCALSNF